jgi:hypothetical protein
MKTIVRWLLLAALLGSCATPQFGQVPQPKSSEQTPASADQKARVAVEDAVAQQFTEIRKKAGLPPLKRIKDRRQLRQQVCTAAVRGKVDSFPSMIFYTTNDPRSGNPGLEKIAKTSSSKPAFVVWPARFSIAAWPAKSPDFAPGTYWIGAKLYLSAAAEFFDKHFTDDIM